MAADITTYDAALKNVYADAIAENLNNKTILLKRLQRQTQGFDGRQFIVPTHGRRNEQIGSISSTGTSLPAAANQAQQGYDNATFTPAYVVGVISISQQLIDQSKGNTGSFVRAVSSEVKRMSDDLAVDVNRQLHGDQTGALTACGVTGASTTVVVTSTALLRTGMGIDVIVKSTGATSTGATGRYVASVTDATHFVISGAAITTDATFSVYRAGSRNLDWNGVQNVVAATGALAGLNPATAGQEYWAATVFGGVGTISEANMQKAFDAPGEVKFGTGGAPSLVIGTFGTRRAYLNLLAGLRRVVNSLDLTAGFTAIEYNGLPFVVDRACLSQAIWFLDESHLMLLQVTPPDFMQEDGKILKWDALSGGNPLGYKGIYRWFGQFATDARDAHASNQGVTEA